MSAPIPVSPKEAQAWLASGTAVLIDVREADEFKAEHIAYAASVPLSRFGELFGQLRLPGDRKLLFQCQKGMRGEQACITAAGLPGVGQTYNLQGGIDGWRAAGLPLVSGGAGGGISPGRLFRQVQMFAGTMILLLVLIGFLGGQTWPFVIVGLMGAGLLMAGITGFCGMSLLLARAPWNRA